MTVGFEGKLGEFRFKGVLHGRTSAGDLNLW